MGVKALRAKPFIELNLIEFNVLFKLIMNISLSVDFPLQFKGIVTYCKTYYEIVIYSKARETEYAKSWMN